MALKVLNFLRMERIYRNIFFTKLTRINKKKESKAIRFSSFQMVDEVTKKTLSNIPLLKTKASPRDGEQWRQRLKEELQALIQVDNKKKTSSIKSKIFVLF